VVLFGLSPAPTESAEAAQETAYGWAYLVCPALSLLAWGGIRLLKQPWRLLWPILVFIAGLFLLFAMGFGFKGQVSSPPSGSGQEPGFSLSLGQTADRMMSSPSPTVFRRVPQRIAPTMICGTDYSLVGFWAWQPTCGCWDGCSHMA